MRGGCKERFDCSSLSQANDSEEKVYKVYLLQFGHYVESQGCWFCILHKKKKNWVGNLGSIIPPPPQWGVNLNKPFFKSSIARGLPLGGGGKKLKLWIDGHISTIWTEVLLVDWVLYCKHCISKFQYSLSKEDKLFCVCFMISIPVFQLLRPGNQFPEEDLKGEHFSQASLSTNTNTNKIARKILI